jgi:myo-inositol-1(or 4)-monophosphatase
MLDKIINIAMEAGEIVREGFGKNFSIEFKTSESNLVTEIDKASEKKIIEYVSKEFPTHGILAEESGEHKNSSEYIWVIDPLDGTTNFAHGLPIFSVSIGVQKKGITIGGVVYDVMQNVMYSASSGAGAYANGIKIKVNQNANIARALLVTGFPYNIKENPENAIGKFTVMTQASRGVRRLGSAAIDLCYVARGVFEGFWEVYLHPWDICAGKLIVEEAGGLVTGFKGEKIDIFSNKILASNNVIHSELLEILKRN